MQALLFMLLHVVGVSVGLAFGPARRVHLVGALGFLLGLAITVVLELAMMCLDLRFTAVRAAVLLVALAAAALVHAARRGALPRRTVVALALWTLGVGVVGWIAAYKNLAVMSYDSHYIVMMGVALADDGGFAPDMLAKLGDYGVFSVVAQSLVGFTRGTFLHGLAPMMAASTIAAFGVMLGSGLDAIGARFRGRTLAVIVVVAAAFSSYMVFRHTFYIHTNLGTAAYLLVFCAAFWLAEVTGETGLLPAAFIALVAVALHRIEGPLIATVFGALAVLPSRLPRRTLALGVVAFAVLTVGWYAVMATGLSPESPFLTPRRCYLVAAVPAGFAAYTLLLLWPRARLLEAVNRRIALVMAIAFAVALACAFALRWDHFATSARGWLGSLRYALYWGVAWWWLAGAVIVGLVVPAPPRRWLFVVGVPAYAALVLLLVWGRDPYYIGIGDSANRMAIHMLPLVFFYLGLKYLALLGRHQDDAPAQPAQARDLGERVVERGEERRELAER